MNSGDREQVVVFRQYLLEQAGQSRSRLMRYQIRRWMERIDAARNDNGGPDEGSKLGDEGSKLGRDGGRNESVAPLKKAA